MSQDVGEGRTPGVQKPRRVFQVDTLLNTSIRSGIGSPTHEGVQQIMTKKSGIGSPTHEGAKQLMKKKTRKIFQVNSLLNASLRAGIVAEDELEDLRTKKSFTLYTLEIDKDACTMVVACPDINSSSDTIDGSFLFFYYGTNVLVYFGQFAFGFCIFLPSTHY